MTISTLPTFPDRTTDQDTFITEFVAYNDALVTLGTEINADAAEMDAAAVIAADAAGVLAESKWISGTTYALGDVVWSPTSYRSYRRKIAGAGTTDPASDTTNWIDITAKTNITRTARTSNTILGVADHGKLFEMTTASFTQTLEAAATLGDGWWVIIHNSSSTALLLDPNSTEQIDGLATYSMYAGEARLIICTGSAFYSVILKSFFQSFSSGTFTTPPGYKAIAGRMWGGGQSGQRNNNTGAASKGGAGGGCMDFCIPVATVGASQTVTKGTGGTAVTTVADGVAGGNSSFGSLAIAYGGSQVASYGGGGLAAACVASPVGFEGGSSTATPGTAVWGGSASSSDGTAVSANAVYGGAAGGSMSAAAAVKAAGTSTFGGSGGAAASASNGTAGSAPGGGGGATQTGTQSGAGGDGAVYLWGV